MPSCGGDILRQASWLASALFIQSARNLLTMSFLNLDAFTYPNSEIGVTLCAGYLESHSWQSADGWPKPGLIDGAPTLVTVARPYEICNF
jgi:hypothetical protein